MSVVEEKTVKTWLKETQKGHIRLAVLMLLNKQPLHGYKIMKEIEMKTLGFWKPTAGGIYPILKKLEKRGHIRGTWLSHAGGRKKKVYHITDYGKQVLEHTILRQSQIAQSMEKLFEEFARDVLGVPYTPPPRRLDFLAMFMEEGKTLEEKLSLLRKRRAGLENMMRWIRQSMEVVDSQLSKLEAALKK